MTEINCPVWWKSTLEDVEETLALVKRGTVTELARSAGGRPIYKVEYGKSNVKMGSANLSSALGAHDVKCFADKTGDDYVPTLFLDGAVHGGEFEGTMSLLNLIKEIETGTDYNGDTHPTLMDLVSRVHLVIIPVSNPDGRARIPFRSFLGRTFEDLRYYNQGTWKKDGTLCGWPGCKTIHPIKEASDFLGAYFNDDGYNMMHEDYFDNPSNETRAVFDICRHEAPDFSVLLHGGTNSTSSILYPTYHMRDAWEEVDTLSHAFEAHLKAEGLKYYRNEKGIYASYCLPEAMYHICGAPCVTFESNQGLLDAPGDTYTAEVIHKTHLILFEELCRFILKKFGKI
ncbi:MAG: hypothetical protein IJD51_03570 [Clostridia bacterium]|nr:hypothetical protein [Clostridia bacterium]